MVVRLPRPDRPTPRRGAADVRVARVAEVRAAVHGDLRPNERALSRAHIERLRTDGVLPGEVVDLARNLLGDAAALRIADDLDSYGPWAS